MSGDQPSERMRVVVIGGGSAGWMTAAALATLLPHRAAVALVESEEIGTVGVGEATLPSLRVFNETLGIPERDFMVNTQATYKFGIEFRDWARIGDRYFNPFGTHGRTIDGCSFHHFWAMTRSDPGALPIDAYSLPVVAARLARFAPELDPNSALAPFGYAYQFEATSFARHLRLLAEARGCVRHEGQIVQVARNQATGDVAGIKLSDGRSIEGDLFVDCSGFRSLLLGDELAERWEDWSAWLPCDRAVAIPCRSDEPLLPYTTATAMPAGWRWRIPLQHRVGNGYVYASDQIGDDEACAALFGSLEGRPLSEPRFLRFRAGRRQRSWVGNVVGAGLASGFLEPLESTSLYLVQVAIHLLMQLFPTQAGITPAARAQFNRQIDLEYDRIRDFLILHYHANERTDSAFWERARAMPVPDTLTERLELWRLRGRVPQTDLGLFPEPSWVSVLVGQRVYQEAVDQRAMTVPSERVARILANLAAETRVAAEAMPDHAAVLTRHSAAV